MWWQTSLNMCWCTWINQSPNVGSSAVSLALVIDEPVTTTPAASVLMAGSLRPGCTLGSSVDALASWAELTEDAASCGVARPLYGPPAKAAIPFIICVGASCSSSTHLQSAAVSLASDDSATVQTSVASAWHCRHLGQPKYSDKSANAQTPPA